MTRFLQEVENAFGCWSSCALFKVIIQWDFTIPLVQSFLRRNARPYPHAFWLLQVPSVSRRHGHHYIQCSPIRLTVPAVHGLLLLQRLFEEKLPEVLEYSLRLPHLYSYLPLVTLQQINYFTKVLKF